MSIFGWDYPPGCSSVPGDEDDILECPSCGGPNADDDGNWVCEDAPGFCSVACSVRYQEEQEEHYKDDAPPYDADDIADAADDVDEDFDGNPVPR